MQILKYTFVVFLAAMSAVVVFKPTNNTKLPVQPRPVIAKVTQPQVLGITTAVATVRIPELSMPIADGLVRVTKKPFGLKVSPDNSPVENDIFSGFHTGIDFEIFPGEENTDVAISASCDGQVVFKEWAKGYGGVLVQACQIDGADVTIIYGHLNLNTITAKVGQTLLTGDFIGLLGQGYSIETDGRRKHLHFDIHKGLDLNILGYVPTEADLANWTDPVEYLK